MLKLILKQNEKVIMKVSIKLIFTLILSLASLKAETIIHNNTKIDLKIPKDWTLVSDLYGVPYAVISPILNSNSRTIISITPTKRLFKEIQNFDSTKEEAAYLAGREKWLMKYDGSILSVNKYKKNGFRNFNLSHEFGYRYKLADTSKEEISIYASCNEKILHVKGLMDLIDENQARDMISNIVSSIRCSQGK